jgi:hypothetical protein
MGKQRNVTEEFGIHAGRVWTALNSHGPLHEDELKEVTCLRKNEIHAAVGWLAREDKVAHEENKFHLMDTNLTLKIGSNAGKVWKLLQTWREVNVAHISEYLDMDEKDIFSALGWLAREGKIHLSIQKRN